MKNNIIGATVKVYELITKLQQMPADVDAYIGWTVMNDSGTTYDTGRPAAVVEKETDHGKDTVVIR